MNVNETVVKQALRFYDELSRGTEHVQPMAIGFRDDMPVMVFIDHCAECFFNKTPEKAQEFACSSIVMFLYVNHGDRSEDEPPGVVFAHCAAAGVDFFVANLFMDADKQWEPFETQLDAEERLSMLEIVKRVGTPRRGTWFESLALADGSTIQVPSYPGLTLSDHEWHRHPSGFIYRKATIEELHQGSPKKILLSDELLVHWRVNMRLEYCRCPDEPTSYTAALMSPLAFAD
ncbi:MAG TPA: hypothetical protein VGP72_00395 [Planctomycetota bacterium]|jgi:hypothetical protein